MTPDPTQTPPSSYPPAATEARIRANLASVRRRIDDACYRCGRDPATVRLLPVSKTVAVERLRLAYAAGCRELGENKVQEARHKHQTLADLTDLRWSVIGHLQTNKARYVARFASEFQALDSIRVAEALERRLQQEGRALDVMVQVNTSGEDSKYGLAPDQVAPFLKALTPFSCLRVRGLMTLALWSSDTDRVRACFVRLRQLRDQLRQSAPDRIDLTHLSMGMSGDFETAIEEGATVVRVGQAIFGARPLPDSHYWPDAASSPAPQAEQTQ
ncbi:YggS family pyridoxal phosphate-dependent enzyme [Alloalcanivorax xenomutans]|uniref:YggS family pyridoxal phosphate-dependent enzyme n=1 Tax=Alloalcanivorax xenomutans TaxID=1094342 RepID=UPI003BA987F4